MIKYLFKIIISQSVIIISKLTIAIFKIKNHKKQEVLLFTDSRGYKVGSILTKRTIFGGSYSRSLLKKFSTKVFLGYKKYNTLIDFLCYAKKNSIQQEVVILHLGVVDFSPRPRSSYEEVIQSKKDMFYEIFGFLPDPKVWNTDDEYNGEKTYSLYDESFLKEFIIPCLKKYNIYYISCNSILVNWNGSYSKKRPVNMNRIMKYDELLRSNFNHLNLYRLSDEEIKRYTVDNVHFNTEGFCHIEKQLTDDLQSIK